MSKDSNNWLLLILGALLLGGGGIAVYTMTRGLRNNNPGNIIDDGTAWEGLDSPRNDGTFLRFTDVSYGIRAMARTLSNYIALDGVPSTVDALIRRWSKTDQDAYVTNVSRALGVDPTATIDLASSLPVMIPAMISQENGFNPYSDATIAAGIALA